MADETESLYKRDEDREWRKEVDRNRALLTTAVNVLQEQVREAQRLLHDHQATLHGERGNVGLVAEYERHDGDLTKLKSVIFTDSTGKHGLLHEVELLSSGERKSTAKQKIWIAIVGLLSAATVAIFSNLDKIEKFIKKEPPQDEFHRRLERAKRPPKRRTTVRYRVIPPPAQEPLESNDSPPEQPPK